MATRSAVTPGDAIYARYSSELQNPRSCDDQIVELEQALARRGGRFDEHLVLRLPNRQLRPTAQKLVHQTLEVGRQMLQHHKRHPGIGWQMGEKTLERFEASCRCANPDDPEIDPLVDHHDFLPPGGH